MNPIFVLILSTLCSSGLTYQVNEKQESFIPKLPLRPGDLLRSLDELTSDAQVIYSPLQETPPLKLAQRRAYDDDESNHDNQESESEYDYDKAYENFVTKYFAKGQEDLDSEDTHDDDSDDDGYDEKAGGIDDASPYRFSGEIDTDPKDEEKSSSSSGSGSKTCERIKIDNQNCKVCEDPKTNEKSKTCSYSSDDRPKSYGYSKQRSTKHSSDDDDDDDDDDKDDDDGKSLKRETSPNNKSKFKPRRTSIEHILKPSSHLDDLTKCTRKFEDGMICFYCTSTSENTRECIVDKSNLKKRRLDEASKKDTATKKIFKRMVTYSFKNDAEPKFKENTYSAFQGY